MIISDETQQSASGSEDSSSVGKHLAKSLGHLVTSTTDGALQVLLSAIPDLIWLKDPDGVYLFCNPSFERFFGAGQDDILGKTDYDFVERELADFFREHDLKSVEKGEPSINEEWLTFAEDGYQGLFETIKTPIFDQNGAYIGVLGIARDITKLHDTQAKLRERQTLLETLVSLAGSAIALIDPHTGRFIEFNEAAHRNLGYSREAFAKLTVADIEGALSPEKIREHFRLMLEQGGLRFDTRHRHRDGHLIDMMVNTSLVELQGRTYIESLWTDITAIKQAERELRQREKMLARTERLAHLGSWEWDLATDVVTWSDELFQLLQIDPAEGAPTFAEQEQLGLYHAEDFQRLKAVVAHAQATGQPYEIELRTIRANGEFGVCIAHGECEYDEDGQVSRLTGYLRDITSQRQAEQAMRDSETQLARAQQVAHVGSWSIDVPSGQLIWSDETYRIFGMEVGEPLHYDIFLQHIHPDDAARVDLAWKQALAGAPYDVIHRIIVHGRVKWVQERAELETGADGALRHAVGTVQDITQQWREHTLLETSTETLRLLAEGGSLKDALDIVIRGVEAIDPDMIVSVMLQEDEGRRVRLGAGPSLPQAYAEALLGVKTGADITVFEALVSSGQAVFIEDIECDRRWRNLAPLALSCGLRACWSLPICSSTGRGLGAFVVYYREPGLPDSENQRLIEQVGTLVRQVIEQVRAQEALRLSARVIEHSHSAIIVTDAKGVIVAVNPAFTEVTGYSEEEAIGRNPNFLQSGRQSESFYRSFWKSLKRDGYWRGELWNRRKDGSYFAQWLTASAVRDELGNITQFIGISDDITDNKAATARIEFLAYHDPLTELPNRQLARDRLEQAMARTRREEDGHFALLFVDLDQFKGINDALGHTVGDGLIRAAAERLQESVRETDTVSRQGGDEFLIMLTGDVEMHTVSRVCSKLLAALSRPFNVDGHTLSVSASIGVSMYPDDGEDFDTLMKKADMAMYSAKDAGRNTFRFFAEKMNADVMDRILVRNGLLRALEHNEFVLHYQPQVDLNSGQVVGVEALVRWQHPDIGLVPPDRFIPVAESSGLIVEMGRWVLREACRQLRVWREMIGCDDMIMAVNISVLQFTRGNLEEAVVEALRESGIPPSMLELELTESVLLKEAEQALEVMNRLRALGVKMSIDDFGTGYSSLSYLKQLPVDKLKIDRSFVKDVTVDADDAAIAHAVISLAHILGLHVIAEGVENEEQLDFLRTRNCDQYQGYLFSRPLPAETCEKLLLKASAQERR
ncbi:hypothetical protein GCM10009104_31100 [Marinobacterium maritimum]|uniref:PAS domain S-box-containing protein/diguanylate cyclase (GGDEF) domain-containing protein n=1 Tax=Marinobacterium maritimum TaxID=500162 RepID=A0ABP3TGB0_9GAMM